MKLSSEGTAIASFFSYLIQELVVFGKGVWERNTHKECRSLHNSDVTRCREVLD